MHGLCIWAIKSISESTLHGQTLSLWALNSLAYKMVIEKLYIDLFSEEMELWNICLYDNQISLYMTIEFFQSIGYKWVLKAGNQFLFVHISKNSSI